MMTPMNNNDNDNNDNDNDYHPPPPSSGGYNSSIISSASSRTSNNDLPISSITESSSGQQQQQHRRRRRRQEKQQQQMNGNDNNDKTNNEQDDVEGRRITIRDSQEEEEEELHKKEVRKQRRRNRKNHQQKNAGSSSSSSGGGGGSVLWTILVIGIIFCLIDVIYIIYRVDRQTEHNQKQQQQQQSLHNNIDNNNKRPMLHVKHPHPIIQHELNNNSNNNNNNNNELSPEMIKEKQPIIDILKRAHVDVDLTTDDGIELFHELPKWDDVVQVYGDKPIIYGLDQCEKFQKRSDPADHFVSTAGTFNSGTNLMAELLIHNCHMQPRMDKYGAQNRGIRWQVPWGKHTPPGDEQFRQTHKTSHDASIDANNILPAVTIRDPLIWLKSMCRHPYAAKWRQMKNEDHCPNFSTEPYLQTRVKYAEFERYHNSILHLWNDYYNDYLNATFPRLIVRFEDLVFHVEEVTKTVCECAGGSLNRSGKFIYITNSAKKGKAAHGKERTGYVDAIIKYGTMAKRYNGYYNTTKESGDQTKDNTKKDLQYIYDNVDTNLMTIMNYPMPNPNYYD